MSQIVTDVVLTGAAKAGMAAKQALSKSMGYDFISLIQGLVIIFLFAKVIELYVNITSGVESGWLALISFFGFNVPTNAPTPLVQLVSEGYAGVKYWDIIKGLMILIVFYEWFKVKDVISTAGHGAFGMIAGFLALITFPDLFKRLKEMNLLSPGMARSAA